MTKYILLVHKPQSKTVIERLSENQISENEFFKYVCGKHIKEDLRLKSKHHNNEIETNKNDT